MAKKRVTISKNKTQTKTKLTLKQYLDKLSVFVDSKYGSMIRTQFRDIRGSSELAMLAAPSSEELEQLRRAVAIMTPVEKAEAEKLSDEQVAKIAADAGTDPAIFAIFVNGYAQRCKRVS